MDGNYRLDRGYRHGRIKRKNDLFLRFGLLRLIRRKSAVSF